MATGYQHNQQQQYIPTPQQYQQYAQQAHQYQQQMQMQQYAQNTQQYQQYAQTSHALQGAAASANGLLQPGRPKGAVGKKGKKAKDPNRPKRPTSAYFFFIASKREEAKLRGQHISKVAEWTKQVSALWREMPAPEKQKFDKKAVVDKGRYEREMQAYSGKRPKDENKPKRPQSAYFLFLGDFRLKNKQNFTGEGSHKELIRAAGEAWNGLSPQEKHPYEILAEKEKRKYEEAMKIYNQGGGMKKPRTEDVVTPSAAPTLGANSLAALPGQSSQQQATAQQQAIAHQHLQQQQQLQQLQQQQQQQQLHPQQHGLVPQQPQQPEDEDEEDDDDEEEDDD